MKDINSKICSEMIKIYGIKGILKLSEFEYRQAKEEIKKSLLKK